MLMLVSAARAQPSPGAPAATELKGLSQQELIRRVFDGEKKTIAQFSKREPIVETYAQSLDPEATPAATIDDVYFLGKVSLDPDSRYPGPLQRFAFGATEKSRRIRLNTGNQWPLYPDAEVSMLFIDINDFDKSHYQVKVGQLEMLGDTECLRLSVSPVDLRTPGQFVGDVWVETSGFHIVRIQGTFTPRRTNRFEYYLNSGGISSVGIFFHFDSYRQEVTPGVWLPSYTYFNEERTWNAERVHFTTSFRFRGIVSVWGYQTDAFMQMEEKQRNLNDPVKQLQASGLIGRPGQVEEWLNGIVQDIQAANNLSHLPIECRVLLTTPVEIFSVGNTVLVSRGLLNLVPDNSILAVLLAREVAHINLGHSHFIGTSKSPIFEAQRGSDFPGFGIQYNPLQEAAANARALQLLQGTQYAQTVPLTDQFLSLLALHSSHIPHLLRPSFGVPLVERHREALAPPGTTSSVPPQAQPALQLREEYVINSWTNMAVLSGTAGSAALTGQSAPDAIAVSAESH